MSENGNILIILSTEPVKNPQPLPVPREPQPGPSTAPDTPIGIKTVSSVVSVRHVLKYVSDLLGFVKSFSLKLSTRIFPLRGPSN